MWAEESVLRHSLSDLFRSWEALCYTAALRHEFAPTGRGRNSIGAHRRGRRQETPIMLEGEETSDR